MVQTSRFLEAPRRLRAFVRAHETSLVVLAALIGTIGGVVVLAMSIAVAGLHALLFNISIRERLSSQASIETLRALLVPSLGGLLLGLAFLGLSRWRPARKSGAMCDGRNIAPQYLNGAVSGSCSAANSSPPSRTGRSG